MRKAVVLLSGGLDSSTVLAIAKSNGYECHALSFRYGQRHSVELACAEEQAKKQGCASHTFVNIDFDAAIGGSALVDSNIAVPKEGVKPGIPVTYVPARNSIFLAFALAKAEAISAEAIFIGVNALDYSGYPDCRPEFIAAFQELAKLATKQGVDGNPVSIFAPLVNMTKAEIIRYGEALGVDYALTHSCYDPNELGDPCGECDSCRLREKGFEEAGCNDPAL